MSAITTTLAIYREAFTEAAKGLPRSAYSLLVLLASHILLEVLEVWLVAPVSAVNAGNGFLMGFVVAFIHAGLIGLYLYTVEIGVKQRRRVSWGDIQRGVQGWVYLWEVISVFFIFFIASLVLMPFGPIAFIAVVVATLVFNPMPEQIYLDGTTSTDLLAAGARFMQHNWPEWLGFHVIAAAVLMGFGMVMGAGSSFGLALSLVQVFGPFCGFIDAGRMAFEEATRGPVGIVSGVFLLVFVHFFMLVRGHMYQKLSKGNRRQRAWQARMEGR